MDILTLTRKAITYNFMVFLGPLKVSCAKVSGVENVLDTTTVSEGGVNDRVYTLEAPAKTEKTLILERGSCLSLNAAEFILVPGYRFTTDIIVFVLDIEQIPRFVYSFSGCYVKKVKYGDLDASRSEVLMERVEIAYETVIKTPAVF
ncbi:MAG: phage tail protein [Lachnospiraceae bacterium]|nr:phage tail protein [Lachnospiraceae bacterium]